MVEVPAEPWSECPPQFIHCRLLDTANRSEAVEQRTGPARSDAGHCQELRRECAFRTPYPVSADGKTMGLIACFAQHEMGRVRGIES